MGLLVACMEYNNAGLSIAQVPWRLSTELEKRNFRSDRWRESLLYQSKGASEILADKLAFKLNIYITQSREGERK